MYFLHTVWDSEKSPQNLYCLLRPCCQLPGVSKAHTQPKLRQVLGPFSQGLDHPLAPQRRTTSLEKQWQVPVSRRIWSQGRERRRHTGIQGNNKAIFSGGGAGGCTRLGGSLHKAVAGQVTCLLWCLIFSGGVSPPDGLGRQRRPTLRFPRQAVHLPRRSLHKAEPAQGRACTRQSLHKAVAGPVICLWCLCHEFWVLPHTCLEGFFPSQSAFWPETWKKKFWKKIF